MNKPHVIRRQHLHVTLEGTEAEGFALQHRLSALCHDWLVPAIETALDRCAPTDGYLYLEHLTIDAGAFRPERLEHDLAGRVGQAIEEAILAQTSPAVSGQAQRKTEPQTALEALLYFLENGQLRWSFRLPPNTLLEAYLRTIWGKTALRTTEMEQIRQLLGSPTPRRRLVGQFSGDFLEILLLRISPSAHNSVQALRAALRGSDRPTVFSNFEKRLWETAFAQAATNGQADARTLLKSLKMDFSTLPLSLQARLETLLGGPLPAAAAPLALESSLSTPPKNQPPSPFLDKEGLYVDNAGLIILHPFVPMFLEGLGFARDGLLLQPNRALHLLHYLCTGESPAPEYALALPKVLCNIPLTEPVDIDVVLTELEKEEALALLQAVIRHWEALQSAAPDALRGTFLLRPGKLSRRDDGGWLLEVEKQGFDILLDQLPWGIGMVQLPWMEQLLWVEWN